MNLTVQFQVSLSRKYSSSYKIKSQPLSFIYFMKNFNIFHMGKDPNSHNTLKPDFTKVILLEVIKNCRSEHPWISIDESDDAKGGEIDNVIIRVLGYSDEINKPYLRGMFLK